MTARMIVVLARLMLGMARHVFRSREDLMLEILALRQQLATFRSKRPRPKLRPMDRAFWLVLSRAWDRWAEVLQIVEPDTVVRWHRELFRRHWRRRSKAPPGRPRVDREIRALVRRTARENAAWGAPRIHGELLKLGFQVSERTVSRYMPQRPAPRDVIDRWMTFLRNHREAIVAIDFFTVPTARFRVLYVFFVLHHDQRRIVHVNVTERPTSTWVCQQLREAFPDDTAPQFLIADRDPTFSVAVRGTAEHMGIRWTRTAPRRPWQNGAAERWIASVRRELLDHVVVLGEDHLRRLLASYVSYLPGGSLPPGVGKGPTDHPTGVTPAVVRSDGCRVATSRWPSPPVRVAGGSVGPRGWGFGEAHPSPSPAGADHP